MIITKIRLQEKHPMAGPTNSWPLPLCDLNVDSEAGVNGYILKETLGLNPPALVAIVEGFDSSGIPVLGAVAENRELAFRIALSPGLGQSYSSLRDDLYKFIDKTVLVNLMNDSMITAQATGYIQQCEAVHFSNQPDIQMTIECQEGEFVSPKSVNIPFSDLTSLQPIINYNEGTAPTGLDLQCTVTAIQSGFAITEHSKFWDVSGVEVHNVFQVIYPFLVGDVINISTSMKNKRITRTRAGVTLDIAGYINAGAVWPKLYSGVNTFHWTFASSWMTWTAASYIPKYWGV
jgi:hypothetical protein